MKPWRELFATTASGLVPTIIAAATCAAILFVPGATESAVANGETRTIHLHHAHTHESIDATYLVDGHYDPVVLEKLNWFLRDWRRDEPTHMDPKLFDTISEVYRESGSHSPIEVMSAYRSPETNAMLRRASRSVAEHSQHILGKAMDQHYVDVPMSKIREIAMRLQRGGVGFYPTAGTPFVHMDVGGVRHWPRMNYDQLSRLFPDGKTVHIPSNGQPLPGYEMARAELEARGDSFNYPTVGEVKSKGFFAWLFGGGDDEGDGEAAREGGVPRDAAPSPRRSDGRQLASIDAAPVGSTGNDGATNGKDTGFHLFAFLEPKPPAPAPAPAPSPAPGSRREARARALVASLPSAQPIDPQAQQTLALEMQRQSQARAAQAQADLQAQQAAAQAQAANRAQQAEASAQSAERAQQAEASAQTLAAAADPAPHPAGAPVLAALGRPDAPLPPRRPVEFASLGPQAPVPPSRPGDVARSDHAPTPEAIRGFGAGSAVARAGLPAAITQGFGQPPAPPRVLSFAPPAGAPSGGAMPLPVARPQLVAARLDRSNFRSLTGATPAERQVPRAGMGSAVSALRPAALASAGSLAGDGSTVARHGFGTRATDLPTDRFSGAAVTPQERVSTATLRKRPAAATADD